MTSRELRLVLTEPMPWLCVSQPRRVTSRELRLVLTEPMPWLAHAGVGVVIIVHGGVLLTDADRLGSASGPLMVAYALVMLRNQALRGTAGTRGWFHSPS